MPKQNKIRVVVAFSVSLVIAALVFAASFDFSLSNMDEESRGNVLLSQRDELYLVLPNELQTTTLDEIRFRLEDEKGNSIRFNLLSKLPPYDKVDRSKEYDHLIISIEPNYFEKGNYTLSIIKGKKLFEEYNLKLRYEITAPWDYF